MPKPIRTQRASFSRRDALRLAGATGLALTGLDAISQKARAQVNPDNAPADKLLFVFTATGGGSITDSFMAVKESEPQAALLNNLIAFPDAYVSHHGGVVGGPNDPTSLRSLDLPPAWRNFFGSTGVDYAQSTFVNAHLDDIAVMTVENTSVNHFVAQNRAITGANMNNGRTLGETIAERHGQNIALPYLNMGTGGYLEAGSDGSLPGFARGEPIAQPLFFALGTDGSRGMVGAPGAASGQAVSLSELDRSNALRARARAVRDSIDDESIFRQTFQCSDDLIRYRAQRAYARDVVEPAELVKNLMYIPFIPLQNYGLEETENAALIRAVVEANPNGGAPRSVFTDTFLAQVVLAYLATRYGYTCAATMGPSFNTDVANLDVQPPLSFDFSHNNHVVAQSVMWSRMLDGISKLIVLLKNTPTSDGKTMWDRSLIYVASDFGRDKIRSVPGAPLSGGTSTGHHLNNGTLLLSPLLNGGRVYGGIDNDTLLTHGFDRDTGVATPSTVMREGDVFSVVSQALDADFPNREDIPCMVKPVV